MMASDTAGTYLIRMLSLRDLFFNRRVPSPPYID